MRSERPLPNRLPAERGAHVDVLAIRGRLLLDGDLIPGTLLIRDGRIAEIVRGPSAVSSDAPLLEADIVSPGFLDLQVNGGFGVEVGESPDALRHLSDCLPPTGVTAYLPTVISSPREFYPRVFTAFEEARGAPGARPLGLHLEGPLLSPERSGAHDRRVVEAADVSLLEEFARHDAVRVVTVAPEREGVLRWISRLAGRGVLVSLGHTSATYEQFMLGVDAGARMGTHLFNAMSPFLHRAPGAVGAALVDERLTAGIIVDGVHSHPAAIRLALRAKGAERVALVTDMISAAGMPPGTYALGGRSIVVEETAARREDGTLAGSTITLDAAIRNFVTWCGIPPAEALRMATEVPARLLGEETLGRLAVGADADLVLLSNDLRVERTLIRGAVVYERAV